MLGLRPSEGRGLRYEDLQQFQSHPERRYLIISGTADKHGKKRKEMKNRYSHRCIPEVYELAELLRIREDFVREEAGDDISKLPIICFENQYTTPCTAVQMANFSKKQLSSIMSGDEFADLSMQMMVNSTQPKASGSAADMDAASADNSLTTYLLRHNFSTMMRAHTTLDSDSIHLLMGHATKKKRCEARNAYSEDSLYKMMSENGSKSN